VSFQKPNAQYNLAEPDSMAARVATRARRRMYDRFLGATSVSPHDTLLDVGATANETYESSNYLEAWYPHKAKITAVGLDDARFLERRYPGVRVTRGDGRALPFKDESFDVVHSSAVLEHVGGWRDQSRFVGELARVARRVVFLTTPNRWFPIEFHTQLPFLHWLPKAAFRRLIRRSTRYGFFAEEGHLNLLTRSEARRLCTQLPDCAVRVDALHLLGWPSNLLIVIDKGGGGRSPVSAA
jgi:ubiquinone/menaquinone biosynthesis C-methylase UbiE